MKTKFLFLIAFICLALYGCEDSETTDVLELSQTSFPNVNGDGETLAVDVTSSGDWTVTNTLSWCKVTPGKGSGDGKLTLQIDANLNEKERTGILTIALASSGLSRTIQITQEAGTIEPENYHYKLPVIFHVLYKDQTDPLQHVKASRLEEILQVANSLFRKSDESVDMNLTFELATTDPEGNPMETPGVEYIEWPGDYPIDCDKFMADTINNYVKYIWEPNRYLNVMMYNFDSNDPNYVTLGISHLPFSTKGSTFLEGLNPVNISHITKENLQFPYCVSINSLYINSQSIGSDYIPSDITVTLAHELGHYLGLHHVFSEVEEDGILIGCEDTDYCKDTPSYNKQEYDDYYRYLATQDHENYKFSVLVKRIDCSGNTFQSHNIMDYAVSYSNQFTNDQRARIRHVLNYSPLIPGPKIGAASTRTAVEGVLDLPIRVIK